MQESECNPAFFWTDRYQFIFILLNRQMRWKFLFSIFLLNALVYFVFYQQIKDLFILIMVFISPVFLFYLYQSIALISKGTSTLGRAMLQGKQIDSLLLSEKINITKTNVSLLNKRLHLIYGGVIIFMVLLVSGFIFWRSAVLPISALVLSGLSIITLIYCLFVYMYVRVHVTSEELNILMTK